MFVKMAVNCLFRTGKIRELFTAAGVKNRVDVPKIVTLVLATINGSAQTWASEATFASTAKVNNTKEHGRANIYATPFLAVLCHLKWSVI